MLDVQSFKCIKTEQTRYSCLVFLEEIFVRLTRAASLVKSEAVDEQIELDGAWVFGESVRKNIGVKLIMNVVRFIINFNVLDRIKFYCENSDCINIERLIVILLLVNCKRSN